MGFTDKETGQDTDDDENDDGGHGKVEIRTRILRGISFHSAIPVKVQQPSHQRLACGTDADEHRVNKTGGYSRCCRWIPLTTGGLGEHRALPHETKTKQQEIGEPEGRTRKVKQGNNEDQGQNTAGCPKDYKIVMLRKGCGKNRSLAYEQFEFGIGLNLNKTQKSGEMIMKSKRIAVATLVLLGFIACASASTASSTGIKWYSYEEGMALGKKLGKKVFIDFYADWCGYCRMMDGSTFKDASVIAILNRDFIPVKVHSDEEKEIALKYNIRALPNIAFISEDGKNIGSLPGYITSDRLVEILEEVKKLV